MSKNNTYRGHEYVDLGLSVLWATCNIGAVIPEDYGDYYTWEAVREMYSKSSGEILSSYDLACLRWGSGWRLPTNEEINELIENCDYEWTKLNGAYGGKFTRHGSIFLSAAGWYHEDAYRHVGDYGGYWGAVPVNRNRLGAPLLVFNRDGGSMPWSDEYIGFTIRPVVDKKYADDETN